jgi:hypothetical protein
MSSDTPSFRLWPVNSTFVYLPSAHLSLSFSPCMPYLLNINARRAFEHLVAISFCLPQPTSSRTLPAQQPDHLSVLVSMYSIDSLLRPLTSRLQNLSRPLGAIRQRQSHNLIVPREFDLSPDQHTLPIPSSPLLLLPSAVACTHILQNHQRPIDTANSIIPDPGRNAVRRRFPRVSHGCYKLADQCGGGGEKPVGSSGVVAELGELLLGSRSERGGGWSSSAACFAGWSLGA